MINFINRGLVSFIYNKILDGIKLSVPEKIFLQAHNPIYSIMTKKDLLNLLEKMLHSDFPYVTYFKPTSNLKYSVSANIVGKKQLLKYKGRYMTLCTNISLIVCSHSLDCVQDSSDTPLKLLINKYPTDLQAVIYSIYPDDFIDTIEVNSIEELDALTEYTLDNGDKVFNEFILSIDENNFLIAINDNNVPKFYMYTKQNNGIKEITINDIQMIL